MAQFVCTQLQKDWVGNIQCVQWEQLPPQSSFYSEFAKLTFADVSQLYVAVALYFCACWGLKRLSFQTRIKF